MAKARARVVARKVKDKWKGKAWYDIMAPAHFGQAKIATSLADEPQKIMGRIAETTLQELTGDFKQMHVKLQFRVDQIDGTVARTHYAGHSLTSDYLRRMTRRNHSKVDAVAEVTTKDGGIVRVKPFTVSDRRMQTTQEQALRSIMVKEIENAARESTLNRLVRDIVDGKLAAQISKSCRVVYPVRRVEIQKTEVKRLPQVEMEEDWAAEFAAKAEAAAAAAAAPAEEEAPVAEEAEAETPAEEAPVEEAPTEEPAAADEGTEEEPPAEETPPEVTAEQKE